MDRDRGGSFFYLNPPTIRLLNRCFPNNPLERKQKVLASDPLPPPTFRLRRRRSPSRRWRLPPQPPWWLSPPHVGRPRLRGLIHRPPWWRLPRQDEVTKQGGGRLARPGMVAGDPGGVVPRGLVRQRRVVTRRAAAAFVIA